MSAVTRSFSLSEQLNKKAIDRQRALGLERFSDYIQWLIQQDIARNLEQLRPEINRELDEARKALQVSRSEAQRAKWIARIQALKLLLASADRSSASEVETMVNQLLEDETQLAINAPQLTEEDLKPSTKYPPTKPGDYHDEVRAEENSPSPNPRGRKAA